jgi:hypothetical protein
MTNSEAGLAFMGTCHVGPDPCGYNGDTGQYRENLPKEAIDF